MKRINLYLAILLGFSMVVTGCFDDPGSDIVWEGSIVEIQEATTAAGASVTTAYEQADDGVPTPATVRINLASRTLSEPVTVTYEVSGSAIEGVHYNMISSGNSVTIPAGEHYATINYEVLTYNISPEDVETLTFTITGATGADVSSNYSTFTSNIRTLCTSAIPEGEYMETNTGGMSTLTKIGSNVYRFSDMNWSYYTRGYGAIFGEFTDVCDELTLNGVAVSDVYDIAWIGSGTFDSETNTLTFEISDATYNAGAIVSQTYVLQE